MPVVGEWILQAAEQEEFRPEAVSEQLGFFPEIFSYLKKRHGDMGRTRPVVTLATAVTVWAFRQSGDPVRPMPREMLETLWERLSQGGMGDKLSGFLERMEPNMWHFFLRITETAAQREQWEQSEIAASALIYAPVLTSCIYAFWPEEKLPTLEEGLSSFGLGQGDGE